MSPFKARMRNYASIEGFVVAMAAALASINQASGHGRNDFGCRPKAIQPAFLSPAARKSHRSNAIINHPIVYFNERFPPVLLSSKSIANCESVSNSKQTEAAALFPIPQKSSEMGYNYVKLNDGLAGCTSLQDTHALFGTLRGDGMIERYDVHRRVHSDSLVKDDVDQDPSHLKEIIVVDLKMGHKLNGHDKIVHGGIISLLIDEGMGWAAYESLEHHNNLIAKEFTPSNTILVTANLNIDFRAPFVAGSKAVLRVYLDEENTNGRKMYFVAKLESYDGSVLFAEAKSLFLCVPSEKISLMTSSD
jgi:acyl-coenzyme A thioesterase PaaI-like protein